MSTLTFNLAEGSVSFNFTPQAAQELKTAFSELMNSLKVLATKPTGEKPTPQKPMEYRYTGDVFLEIFCNPNIYNSPFTAKLLITLRDDRIRVSSEAELTRILEDVNHYLEQVQ